MKNTIKTASETEHHVKGTTTARTPVKEIEIKNNSPALKAISSQDDEVLARAIRDLLKRDKASGKF